MTQQTVELQELLFKYLKTNNIAVNMYLINGIKLSGTILDYDKFCVLLGSKEGSPQVIYKHAISTVSPNAAFSYKDLMGASE